MRVGYDDVPVGEDGLTPFQRELLGAARSVSWGEVVTYGGLAALAGRPRAARAAGSFCAQSRLSLVVPCHRIVASGKDEPFGIGGYGRSGLPLKRRLLALEGTLLGAAARSQPMLAPSSPRSRPRAVATGSQRSPHSSTRQEPSICAGAASWRSTSTSPSRPSRAGRSPFCAS
jgi:O-6-methylguanine DNA methyltransferase